jgi:hypothetical protein
MESRFGTSSCSGLPIDPQQVRPVALTERRQPVKAEPDQPVLLRTYASPYRTTLNRLHEASASLALGVQPAAHLLIDILSASYPITP